jgi:DNA polymerase I-like protein with 3'-5' exonuclease and polymerase domains
VDGVKKRTSPKLTEDSFDSIQGSLGKDIATIRRAVSRRGIMEGWVKRLRADGRVSTSIGGKTVTHRLRHSGIVNVPKAEDKVFFGKQMREVWIASPGFTLVGVDSSGCQLRMLCHELSIRGLHNRDFESGVIGGDPHTVNQSKVNAVLGYEAVTRSEVKNVLYATFFGATAPKIMTMLNCSRAKADAVMQALFEVLPEIFELKRILSGDLYNRGYISALDGRPIYIDSPHKALVDLMQGDEAVCMEMSMCKADMEVEKAGLEAYQLIYYHDELDWECRTGFEKELCVILEDAIAFPARHLKLRVPLEGEAKIGKNWGEIH